jgi:hypothetical protein
MVLCVSICVIHMSIVLTDYMNVIPFQGIKIFSLRSRCYDIHIITYGSICRVAAVTSDNMDMFPVSNVKYSSRLSDAFH